MDYCTLQHLYNCFLQCNTVCTDTRRIEPQNMFFALRGENFDGNAFAGEALQRGAAFVVSDRPDICTLDTNRCLLVPDTLQALQLLAGFHRHRLKPNLTVLALTGSNGKTTTKELIRTVLQTKFNTIATIGNLNNHIGVPLTLLSIGPETDIAIVEMGANHQQEIRLLCNIAQPSHGLITGIGRAHLEGFGGIEGVEKGKSELFEYLLMNNGHAFVNTNDERVARRGAFFTHKTPYGSNLSAQQEGIYGYITANMPFVQVRRQYTNGDFMEINTRLAGAYNTDNILASVAVGEYFGLSQTQIKTAIESYCPSNNRSQLKQWGSNQLILDYYNANPTSMAAALSNLAQMPDNAGKKCVILGDMYELGEYSVDEHLAVVGQLGQMSLDTIILIGQNFSKAAAEVGLPCQIFPNTPAAKLWFDSQTFDNCLLLIKGSRSMALEQLLANKIQFI